MTTDLVGEFEVVETKVSTQERYGLKTPVQESVRATNARSKARLNFALSELANVGADRFMKWLDQVAERSPAEAAKLYMELLEFTQPRLKAAQVVIGASASATGPGGKNLRELSMSELEDLARGEG